MHKRKSALYVNGIDWFRGIITMQSISRLCHLFLVFSDFIQMRAKKRKNRPQTRSSRISLSVAECVGVLLMPNTCDEEDARILCALN